jgi:hypothetical protein
MRQLVAIVRDGHVRYLVHDSTDESARQIAQVVDEGLSVPDIVEIGTALASTLRTPARLHPATERPAPIAPAPPVKSKRKLVRKQWGVTGLEIVADIREHEGTTVREIAERLYPDTSKGAVSACSAHISDLVRKGRVRQDTTHEPGVQGPPVRHLYFVQ